MVLLGSGRPQTFSIVSMASCKSSTLNLESPSSLGGCSLWRSSRSSLVLHLTNGRQSGLSSLSTLELPSHGGAGLLTSTPAFRTFYVLQRHFLRATAPLMSTLLDVRISKV